MLANPPFQRFDFPRHGATTTQGLRRSELMRLIREAGREPVERDTRYRPVERTENAFTGLV